MIRPYSLLQHFTAGGLRKEKGAGQVDVDDFLPLVERQILRLSAPGDPGVVDENVDMAVHGHGPIDDRLHFAWLGNVAKHPVRAIPAPFELRQRRREPFFPARAEHQRGARLGEPFRHFEPETA